MERPMKEHMIVNALRNVMYLLELRYFTKKAYSSFHRNAVDVLLSHVRDVSTQLFISARVLCYIVQMLLVLLPLALNYKSSYLQGDDLHAEAMVYDIQSFPKQLQHVLPDIE